MQDKRLFVVIYVVCALLLFACEKYEGTINGRVVYVEDGVEQPAVDAVITKVQVKGNAEIVVAVEKTDTCGNYTLSHVSKGSWKIIGRLEIDSLVYEAVSEAIVIDGANKEVQNLVLLPIKN